MMSMTCHCDIKKLKNSGNDICFLFRLAYNSGFLCKFAAVKKNY